MSVWWVCSWSHGQRWRSVRTSSSKRTSSAPTGAASSGTYSDGKLRATLGVSGKLVSFDASQGVDAVIVKGGPNANVYRYASESRGDSGLTTPTNPSNGQPYGLSHVSLCYDEGGSKGTPPTGGKGTPPKGGGKGTPPPNCEDTSKGTPPGCEPPAIRGRMTGHGQVFDYAGFDKIGWEFRNSVCQADRFPDLKVAFGGAKFVLEAYSEEGLICEDRPGISEGSPKAGFDTIRGQGTGTLDGVPGYDVSFRFTDAGEPGTGDTATILITGPDGGVVLSVEDVAIEDGGNHQAHRVSGRDAR